MEAICRICLSVSTYFNHCLTEDGDLYKKLVSVLSLNIALQDDLPRKVCTTCTEKIEQFYIFRSKTITNESKIYELLKCFQDEKFTAVKKEDLLETLNLKHIDSEKSQLKVLRDQNDTDVKSVFKTEGNFYQNTNVISNTDEQVVNDDEINPEEEISFSTDEQKCLICLRVLETHGKLIKHYNDHKKSTLIDNLNSNFSCFAFEDGSKGYKCNLCKESFNETDVKKHLISHKIENEFKCSLCNRKYKTTWQLMQHSRVHNGLKLSCSYNCGFSTAYAGALKEHEKRHMNEFKYVCEVCNKGFLVKTWYEQHKNIHSGVKPFTCDVCGKAFHMERYLYTHKSKLHSETENSKKYICTHCNHPCISKKALIEHVKDHDGVLLNRGYLCDICGKTLSSTVHLKNHKRTHLGIKPFACSVCNKKFTKKFNLKLHAITHTGVKDHICKICGKRYAQKSTLQRHKNRNHSGTPNKGRTRKDTSDLTPFSEK